jgi:response regulator of citrate/malate metabolism
VLRCTNSYVREHEAEFIEKIRESSAIKNSETVKSCKKQIAKNGYRIAELDSLITGLYESMIKGLLNEERFKQMSDDYEREQKELKDNTAVLQTELDAFASDSEKAEKYIELARKHANIEELTPAIINTFIERIEVHSIVWSGGIKENGRPCGTRTQDVDVYLRYIGKFEIPNTVPVEKTQ